MEKDTEKRKSSRINARWPIIIYKDDGGTVECESKNISIDGIYLCSDEPLPINADFRMSITPPHHQSIGFTGRVIWSDLYGIDENKSIHGVGICLIEISEEDRQIMWASLSGKQ